MNPKYNEETYLKNDKKINITNKPNTKPLP